MKYVKYGHEKWIREDKVEEILKPLYEFDIRKLVYKPSHETLEQTAHWANKIEKEINKRLKDLTKYGIADYTIVETRDKKKQRIMKLSFFVLG